MASYSNIVTLGPICLFLLFITLGSSLVAQMVKRLPTMWETRVQSLGGEDLVEKEMVTHCSILAWKISWTVQPGRLHSSWGRKESDMTQHSCIPHQES